MELKHKVHKYVRVRLGSKNYIVMKCLLPNCPHYIRLELALGRICICWRCNLEFVLNQKHLKLKKPHCDACTKSRLDKRIAALTEA
jgi:hypothetical protein